VSVVVAHPVTHGPTRNYVACLGTLWALRSYVAWQLVRANKPRAEKVKFRHCRGLPRSSACLRLNSAAFDRSDVPSQFMRSTAGHGQVSRYYRTIRTLGIFLFGREYPVSRTGTRSSSTIKTSGLGASSAPFLCMFPNFGACWHNSGTVPQVHTVYPRNVRPCAILVVEDA
jgi:hypothetical protein